MVSCRAALCGAVRITRENLGGSVDTTVKKTYKKTGFRTDAFIVMECLYEVYQREGNPVLEGKRLQKTMVFPFLKMLEGDYNSLQLNKLHQHLWEIFRQASGNSEFVQRSLAYIEAKQNEESEKLEKLLN